MDNPAAAVGAETAAIGISDVHPAHLHPAASEEGRPLQRLDRVIHARVYITYFMC